MKINRAAIESFLTTAIAVLTGLVALNAANIISVPAGAVAVATAALAVGRTVLAALNPNQKAYGVGAVPAGKHAA